MATLTDRLDHLLGAKTADALVEAFDIRTVEDLLRHYPTGTPHRGGGTEKEPEEGSHVTIIARVVKADVVNMKSRRGQMLKVVLAARVAERRRHVLQPAQGQARGACRCPGDVLRHREVLPQQVEPDASELPILPEPAEGEDPVVSMAHVQGAGSLAGMARATQDSGSGVDMSIFDRELIPLYPATREVESWTILRCVRQVLDQLDTVEDPLPDAVRGDTA